MKVLTGKGVSNGIAIGKLHFFKKSVLDIPTYEVDDIDAELDRYHESMELAKAHLNEIYNQIHLFKVINQTTLYSITVAAKHKSHIKKLILSGATPSR